MRTKNGYALYLAMQRKQHLRLTRNWLLLLKRYFVFKGEEPRKEEMRRLFDKASVY